jgi:FkbM family methyltransferase
MELKKIGGKLRQFCGTAPRLWLPFIRGWLFDRQTSVRRCSFPRAHQLISVPKQDYYESYQYFCETYQGRCEIEAFTVTLKESDVMFDIGGFRGAYSMAAKARFPNLPVYIFEPVTANAIRIQRIIELNQFSQILVKEVAVGEGDSIRGLIDSRDGMLRNTSDSISPCVDIPSCPLDWFVGKSGADPTVIKIDVDGFELQVLKGAEQLLRRSHPRLWIELHPGLLEAKDSSAAIVVAFLESVGYSINISFDANLPYRHLAYHIWAVRKELRCNALAGSP